MTVFTTEKAVAERMPTGASLPILMYHAIPVDPDSATGAMVHVPTGFVGTTGRLDWDSLRELNAHGVELGSHSRTHRTMDVLPDAEITAELMDSSATLRSETGAVMASFCHPHGYSSGRVRKLATRAGYHNACIVGRRVARAGDPLLALPDSSPWAP